jgi:hypothetical protein
VNGVLVGPFPPYAGNRSNLGIGGEKIAPNQNRANSSRDRIDRIGLHQAHSINLAAFQCSERGTP